MLLSPLPGSERGRITPMTMSKTDRACQILFLLLIVGAPLSDWLFPGLWADVSGRWYIWLIGGIIGAAWYLLFPFWLGMKDNPYPHSWAGRIRGGVECVFWPIVLFAAFYEWFWRKLGAEETAAAAARRKEISPEQRSAIATHAARARWAKVKQAAAELKGERPVK